MFLFEYNNFEKYTQLYEGAWGYGPNDSDEYWDEAGYFKKDLLLKLIKGLKNGTKKIINKEKHYTSAYTYMGLTNAILSTDNLISLYDGDELTIQLINAFENAYNALNGDTENLMGWDNFDEYKKNLKKIRNEFYNLLLSKHNMKKDEIKSIIEKGRSK